MRANGASDPTVADQPRSILQHAWSEIQHDLGHKSSATVPAPVRRRFTRLAGLIELADQEFGDIREQLARYDGGLREHIDRIGDASAEIRLDKSSLRAFIRDSRRVRRTDREIAKRLGSTLGRSWVTNTDVDKLRDLNLHSIDAVDRALATRVPTVVSFALAWVRSVQRPLRSWEDSYFPRGIALFYLWYVMLAETGDTEAIARAVSKWEDLEGESLNEWTAQVLHAYHAATA